MLGAGTWLKQPDAPERVVVESRLFSAGFFASTTREREKIITPGGTKPRGPWSMLPIIAYISAPDRLEAPTLCLNSHSRLLAP